VPATRDLTPLLKPRSVAIVGASSRADSLAGRPLANLQRQAFPGAIYPINPQREEIAGLRSYPSVGALPQTPDLAIIIAPGQHALPALEACAERGVRAAIVISAGFGEIEPGTPLRDVIEQLAGGTRPGRHSKPRPRFAGRPRSSRGGCRPRRAAGEPGRADRDAQSRPSPVRAGVLI